MHRPRYHFTPPQNWMNDPNGLIHWKGTYHLFYQHNPGAAVWGDMHWGHATSVDLLHWNHQQIALAPDPSGPDRDGCFSGVAVATGDSVALIYTGVRNEQQLPCLAWATDNALNAFLKYPGNPVIASPPEHLAIIMYRDHTIWREGELWKQLVGAGIEHRGGAVLLYESPDLEHWNYLKPLLVEDEVLESATKGKTSGQSTSNGLVDARFATNGWECPDFFQIEGSHVLTYSLWGREFSGVGYYTGTYGNSTFTPQVFGLVDHGYSFYAPQSFTDASGARIMIGWLREECSESMQIERGWSGAMSIPRVLGIDDRGRLTQTPVPELRTLRGSPVTVQGNGLLEVNDIDAQYLDVEATWDMPPRNAEIRIVHNLVTQEHTTIHISGTSDEASVNTTASSLNPDASGRIIRAPLDLDESEQLHLRLLLDASVLEVFINNRVSVSARVYPEESRDGAVSITSDTPCTVTCWSVAAPQ